MNIQQNLAPGRTLVQVSGVYTKLTVTDGGTNFVLHNVRGIKGTFCEAATDAAMGAPLPMSTFEGEGLSVAMNPSGDDVYLDLENTSGSIQPFAATFA